MNEQSFTDAYNETRNGTDYFFKHSLAPNFYYSLGVMGCAEAGCYWLLDIAATEFPEVMRKHQEPHAILQVLVTPEMWCLMSLTVDDDKPAIWSRQLTYTDLPIGTWLFELADEGERVAMILLSEH